MNLPRRLTRIGLLACLLLPSPLLAAQFCVDSANALTSAYLTGQLLGEAVEIRVVQGSYNLPNGLGAAGSHYPSKLVISGGWTAGCNTRSLNPALTTINGQNHANSGWFISSVKPITIEGLRLFQTAGLRLADVSASQSCDISQLMLLRRNMIQNSVAGIFGAVRFYTYCHRVRVENNLITGANGDGLRMECVVRNDDDGAFIAAAPRYRFLNNTVRDVAGFGFYHGPGNTSGSTCGGQASNNVFSSVRLVGGKPDLIANIYETLSVANGGGLGEDSADNLVFVNPQLDAGYRPIAPGSPAINSGAANVPGGLPDTDIEGNPRTIGTLPDRGAFESNVNDLFLITVTNANNAGAGSLRAAIEQANASPGLKAIQFDIAGACPRTIQLDTPLPNITSSLILNGWSQPLAKPNTQEDGNNANVCLFVRRSATAPPENVPRALNVPASAAGVTLTVRGMAFGGFVAGGGLAGPSAILLQGGTGHRIEGNQFGGIGASVLGNNAAIRIQTNAVKVAVGGSDAGQRNTIANSSGQGIVIAGGPGGHSIVNNYIGTTPAGVAPAPNDNGIAILSSPDNQILDNLISGNALDGIWINGEPAQRNLIAGNRIGGRRAGVYLCGVDPLPACPPLPTNRKGILIEAGASDNRIGAVGSNGSPNRIAHNRQHGVRVMSGQQNRIWGNSIFANGTVETDIDLGAFGVSPAGDDCPGAGAADLANRGQNAPLLHAAEGDGTVGAVSGQLNSCVTSGFALTRLQFFLSSACGSSGHGPGETYIGQHFVAIAGSEGTQGTAHFTAVVEGDFLPLPGRYITATATSADGNTSEFSACVQVQQTIAIFRDGFEPL